MSLIGQLMAVTLLVTPAAPVQSRLDAVVSEGAVGALAEVRDEHGVWRGSSGVAELGTTRKVPVDGRFRVGSVTKAFVATVVLQLVAEGRLRLDDPVDTVPNGATIRDLLGHTSGLYDYFHTLPMPPEQEFLDNRWRTWTAGELIARAMTHPAGEPGGAFSYSNTNYLLLGQIIEKVTGRSYGAEIERRIISPLRLRGTSVPGTSPRIPGPHPHGYVPTLDGLLDYTRMNPSIMGASGEIISTTADLNRFFRALLGGGLLPRHLLSEMKNPRGYGLGLARHATSCGVPVYGSDGDALTYQTWSFTQEDGKRQVTVALTPNFQGDPDDAVDALLDEVFCG
ncbi:D-alanyl-D-alanine carboxypeptidase [Actinoplanes lutulentus]|uniref:D-alanyl-D-alanine carboxypeptidase n=1 Tax=Actinoplanes lutulentus TaxID=1287878 RepID=A0A327YWS8_9ACTN|nr:serine hydrolase domain-containing protein [Actinoplanes lutulentus]MBB2943486.1 D-alanyl-D-alanine carboxypeptidase [Actinoplanes lutulentus]RAK25995.1 D-alanyl-D-alanine carboxypeptidase [Actinoplanes lutulentus]